MRFLLRFGVIAVSAGLVIQLNCAKYSDAQTKDGLSVAKGESPVAPDEAFVVLNYENTAKTETLGSLLERPAPDIKLILDCQEAEFSFGGCKGNFSTDVPGSLKAEIKAYWIESLKFKYKYLGEGFPNAAAEFRASDEFMGLTLALLERLRATTISTDGGEGKRLISPHESEEVIRLLNLRAAELIRELVPIRKKKGLDA